MTTVKQQKALDLERLNRQWQARSLPLKAGATQAVPGEGDPNAAVFLIGEAPGKTEDIQGKPFVGASGKFLTELLSFGGLTREQVFIGNMVKHRPPANRDPSLAELTAYAPWLDEQLAIVQPRVVVTLGRFSMAYMLGGTHTISKVHGQPHYVDNRWWQEVPAKKLTVVPMYHPAAALYSGNLRAVLKADFATIPAVLELIE